MTFNRFLLCSAITILASTVGTAKSTIGDVSTLDEYPSLDSYESLSEHRYRRAIFPKCRSSQYQCRDGSCIAKHEHCDGVIHCPDKSDETVNSCKNMRCPPYVFRCNYGACIIKTAECDGYEDCADGSDELELYCVKNYTSQKRSNCPKAYAACNNGDCIKRDLMCDGQVDCKDGSDEIKETCGIIICPNFLFRCDYGACIPLASVCNNVSDCADDSDESAEICEPDPRVTGVLPATPATPSKVTTTARPKTRKPTVKCIIPENPLVGGQYKLIDWYGSTEPGVVVSANAMLRLECFPGFKISSRSTARCQENGQWSKLGVCIKKCDPLASSSVDLQCFSPSGEETKCDASSVNGTTAMAECKPGYVTVENETTLTCVEGYWSSHVPECVKGALNKGVKIVIEITDKIYFNVEDLLYAVKEGAVFKGNDNVTVDLSKSSVRLTINSGVEEVQFVDKREGIDDFDDGRETGAGLDVRFGDEIVMKKTVLKIENNIKK